MNNAPSESKESTPKFYNRRRSLRLIRSELIEYFSSFFILCLAVIFLNLTGLRGYIFNWREWITWWSIYMVRNRLFNLNPCKVCRDLNIFFVWRGFSLFSSSGGDSSLSLSLVSLGFVLLISYRGFVLWTLFFNSTQFLYLEWNTYWPWKH